MKRFFCTVCKRTKRVRNYPAIIENQSEKSPLNRIGVCNHHSNPSIYSINVNTRAGMARTDRKVS